MAWKIRPLALAAAFIFALTGCEDSVTPDVNPTKSAIRFTPLNELESIGVSDDPLNDFEEASAGSLRILAELDSSQRRIIAYINGDSCGLLITSKADPKVNDIHLVSHFARGDDGTNPYPAGPYNSASGAGSSTKWASMHCGTNAIVIEYTPGEPDAPMNARGHASVMRIPHGPSATRIVIGEQKTREQIADRAKASDNAIPSSSSQ
ncbi:hypothetical protein MTF65_10975 [Streptomyces sp. APSN-46.1]|uniref:hypothetical protein n=1 Tax=Streptomyces sp. APSN-46.1 TaxID=2929049 RepID=UPI001FB36149|nr:hypothetical protein [Streptomyces sp. APSN-46.1]MCJ1677856.1 hypothetical protein [Streptomyces sp. APSN-46.1]